MAAETGIAKRDRADTGRREGGRRIELHCQHKPRLGRSSPRTASVAIRFGLAPGASPVDIATDASIPLPPGSITLITGPSGSGKSSVLKRVAAQFATAINVDGVSFPATAALVDTIAPQRPLGEAIRLLTACGLGEARLWLRRFNELSEGERFRARLARAIDTQSADGKPSPILCDEFCSGLHERAARAVSFNLRKLTDHRRLRLVVATSRRDIVSDLQPDVIVRLDPRGRCDVEQPKTKRRHTISFRRRLRVEAGTKKDYEAFAAMHYRAADELGFVDRVFVLRAGSRGDVLGIIVYAHGPLELALRNHATEGAYSRNPEGVNRDFRIIRRLVVHPDVRGCGLGHELVRRTLPRVGTKFVECLAGMGEFNPVFEKAGMKRIGQYEDSTPRREALSALQAMGVDPFGHDFVTQVARRRAVRTIVRRLVERWYAITTGGGARRVAHQSSDLLARTFRGLVGSRPVYYLWRRKYEKHPL